MHRSTVIALVGLSFLSLIFLDGCVMPSRLIEEDDTNTMFSLNFETAFDPEMPSIQELDRTTDAPLKFRVVDGQIVDPDGDRIFKFWYINGNLVQIDGDLELRPCSIPLKPEAPLAEQYLVELLVADRPRKDRVDPDHKEIEDGGHQIRAFWTVIYTPNSVCQPDN